MSAAVETSLDERGTAWFDATAVVGLALAFLLLARNAQPFAADAAMLVRTGEAVAVTPMSWVRVGFAAALVVALLCRWSVAATVIAWALVAAEAIASFAAWPLILSVIIAGFLSVPDAVGRARTLVDGGRLAAFAGTAAVLALSPIVVIALGTVDESPDVLFAVEVRIVATVAVTTYLLAGAAAAALVVGLPARSRSRGILLLTAFVALVIAVQLNTDRPFSVDALR